MGQSQLHSLAENTLFYAWRESTLGTLTAPAGTDAARIRSFTYTGEIARDYRDDATSVRDYLARITGLRSCTWSLEKYLLPSGAAGTAPDDGALFLTAMGSETNTPSTSHVYSLSSDQALGSCSLYAYNNAASAVALRGAWVESLKISQQGKSAPLVTFEGGAVDWRPTGRSTLNGGLTGGESSVVVATATRENFGQYSLISIGTSTGHLVTARSGATLTVSPVVSGAQSNGAAVVPYAPTQTVAGSPISGTLGGSVTLGGTTLPITSYEVTLANGITPHDDDAFSAVVSDYTPGRRQISGQVTMRLRADQRIWFGHYLDDPSTTRSLVATFGTTAGSICTITAGQTEIGAITEDRGNTEGVINVTLPFVCLGSSGNDALSISFT